MSKYQVAEYGQVQKHVTSQQTKIRVQLNKPAHAHTHTGMQVPVDEMLKEVLAHSQVYSMV